MRLDDPLSAHGAIEHEGFRRLLSPLDSSAAGLGAHKRNEEERRAARELLEWVKSLFAGPTGDRSGALLHVACRAMTAPPMGCGEPGCLEAREAARSGSPKIFDSRERWLFYVAAVLFVEAEGEWWVDHLKTALDAVIFLYFARDAAGAGTTSDRGRFVEVLSTIGGSQKTPDVRDNRVKRKQIMLRRVVCGEGPLGILRAPLILLAQKAKLPGFESGVPWRDGGNSPPGAGGPMRSHPHDPRNTKFAASMMAYELCDLHGDSGSSPSEFERRARELISFGAAEIKKAGGNSEELVAALDAELAVLRAELPADGAVSAAIRAVVAYERPRPSLAERLAGLWAEKVVRWRLITASAAFIGVLAIAYFSWPPGGPPGLMMRGTGTAVALELGDEECEPLKSTAAATGCEWSPKSEALTVYYRREITAEEKYLVILSVAAGGEERQIHPQGGDAEVAPTTGRDCEDGLCFLEGGLWNVGAGTFEVIAVFSSDPEDAKRLIDEGSAALKGIEDAAVTRFLVRAVDAPPPN